MKKFKNVIDAVKEISQPGIARVIMETTPKLLVKGRNSKNPLPEKFEGLKKVAFGTYPIGYEYFAEDKGVGRQLTASGSSPDKFTVEKASGMHKDPTCQNGIVYESDKNPSQKYIRVYKQNGKLKANVKNVYINGKGDFVEISKGEYEDYFPTYSEPTKQLEAGMDEDKVVLPISPKAENFRYLQKGEVIFGDEKEMKKILDLLDK